VTKTALVYPFPMHLSQGYTYHLSILQYVCALSEFLEVHLLSLDTESQIIEIIENQFGWKKPDSLIIRTTKNKYFGLRSNTLFFRWNILRNIHKIHSECDQLLIYTRNVKLASFIFPVSRLTLKNSWRIFECHQIYSINLSIEKRFKEAKKEYLLEQRLYSNCDLVFVNTSILAHLIKRDYDTRVARLPVATTEPAKYAVDQTVARHYDFAYTGTFSQWKGVDVLLEALSLIAGSGWQGRAILVGVNEQDITKWTSIIDEFNLSQHVKLKAKIERHFINDILDQTKIGVVPNSLEDDSILGTSPLKLYDYASRGCHIVATKIPALVSEELAPDLRWATPNNAKDLASTMKQALLSWEQSSIANLNWVSEHSWRNRAKRALSEINELSDIDVQLK